MYAKEVNLLDRYFSQKPERTRISGILYVTDITKSCMLCAYLDIIAPIILTVDKRRLFESSSIIEAFWIDALRSLPDTRVLSTQVPACYQKDTLRIHGRIDALVQHKVGALVVHEVKSTKSLYYVKEPIVEHIDQLQFYLNALGLENGRPDYVDKTVFLSGQGDRVDLSFPVRRDPRTFEGLIHRAIVLESYITAEECPPPEKCWLCRYCGHQEECPVG